jgi:hypothetical protein
MLAVCQAVNKKRDHYQTIVLGISEPGLLRQLLNCLRVVTRLFPRILHSSTKLHKEILLIF